ncbi:MAG TPA: hypothetical protein DDW41_06650 [Candidatus Andersenbacteria bacterium]|nr:hypothetical protein [Candidatus Andersenbacteria bacterium]
MLIIRRKKYYQQEVIYMICKKTMLTIACASLLLPLIALAGGLTPVKPFLGTSSGTLISAITKIVNALLTLAAVVAAIFVIIGGVRYITAQGDEDAIEAAKNTVIYAVIGVVVIALSAVIVNFIIVAIA